MLFSQPAFAEEPDKKCGSAGTSVIACDGNLLAPNGASGPAAEVEDVRLVGGALERSNVSVVEEMVRMIEAQRAYEGASKALMAHDEQTGKLITAYGRG